MSADRHQELAEQPFEGGYPTDESHNALDEELFFQRATQEAAAL